MAYITVLPPQPPELIYKSTTQKKSSCPDININDQIVIGIMPASDRDAHHLSKTMKVCPFCHTTLISVDREKRRCMSCHQYIMWSDETLEEVVEARHKAGVYAADIDWKHASPSKDIWAWDFIEGTYTLLYSPKGHGT